MAVTTDPIVTGIIGNPVHLTELAATPAARTDTGFVYTKDVAGATELFYKDAAGNEIQITSGGGLGGVLPPASVSFAEMQDIATDRILGRDTAGTGDIEELTVGGGIEFTGSTGIQTSAFTGDVTKAAGGTAQTIATAAVTLAKMADLATDRLIGRDTAGTGVPEALTVGGGVEFTGSGGIQRSALTGDVTASAGSGATTIANDAVTYAKMQNVSATDKVLGRSTSGSGDVEEIPCTAAGRALIDDASAAAQRTTLDAAQIGVFPTVAKTGNYTATTADVVIRCDSSGGAFTITLPAASGNGGRFYIIQKTDSSTNAVTIDGNASETVEGATTYLLYKQNESLLITCDGSNWQTAGNPQDISVLASRTTTQSISDSTSTVIAFNAADVFDTHAMHDTVTNNSRITIKAAGKYLFFTTFVWEQNIVFDRLQGFMKNGAADYLSYSIQAGNSAFAIYTTLTAIASMAVNDYVEVEVYQNSGSSLNIDATVTPGCRFGAIKLRD